MSPSTTSNKAKRSFYWSVRRELWENKSLYFAPAIVALVDVVGFIFTAIGLPERRRALLSLDDPLKQRHLVAQPYTMIATMMVLTVFVVAVFYCLDALYGERRDRSILFWKSLPVSDLTAVLSKVTIALVCLPIIGFLFVIFAQLSILVITSLSLLGAGVPVSSTWTLVPFFQNWLILLYSFVAITLWNAPIYSWMLLVSGYVRRAAFLWAVLPWFAISLFERVTFGTTHFFDLMKARCFGFASEAFALRFQPHSTIDSFAQLTPVRYLTSYGLWSGLFFAVICIAGVVQLRRYRGPI